MTLRFKDGGREKVGKDNRRLRKADCARVTAKRTANFAERERKFSLLIDAYLVCWDARSRNETKAVGRDPFVFAGLQRMRERDVCFLDRCVQTSSSSSALPFKFFFYPFLSPHPEPLIMPSLSFRVVVVISLLGAFPFPSSSFLAHFQMAIKRFHPRNFTKGFNLQLPKGEKDEK